MDLREPLKGYGLQEFHIDFLPNKFLSEKPKNIIGYLCLDSVNYNNGSIRIIPKLHQLIGWPKENLVNLKSNENEKTLNLNYGDLVLFNANLLHSGNKNINGKRRRVIFIDYRKRSIPQLLNQRFYLNQATIKRLTSNERDILSLNDNNHIFKERRFTSGDAYRSKFGGKQATKDLG